MDTVQRILTEAERLANTAGLVTELGWGGEAGVRGKLITIAGAPSTFDLVQAITQAAYDLGARDVSFIPVVPELTAMHLKAHADDDEARNSVPQIWADAWNRLVDDSGCTVRIESPDDPLALSRCNGAHASQRTVAEQAARKRFYDEGLFKVTLPWTIIPRATRGWAELVFPGDPNGVAKLQEALDAILCTNDPDCVQRWRERIELSERRAEALNAVGASAVRFVGPGTDLTVGLSPVSYFSSALKRTKHGVQHMANIPTFESFSTPNKHLTRGHFTCTRPVIIAGTLVKGLKVWFNDKGEVDRFEAESGSDAFRSVIETPGGNMLGEVALVGLDGNAIFDSGLTFNNTLLDENAACHVALGRGYPMQLRGGPDMTEEQLSELGCNNSTKHHDVMISDRSTDAFLVRSDESEVQVISAGLWSDSLLAQAC
ncbi:MAG: aminopeptidase [Bdellovibrionales bacterium]|nr:aminopeptidase [Bdellovibrionales bacterium]